jgi:hypothetical protein
MMDGPMKMLVYAIATAMIISLLYIFVFPLAFPPQNSVALIERNLTASETGLGKGFSVEITAGQGNGFTGETFDSSTRNVIFNCNSASQCCPQGEECGLAVEWNSRVIKSNKNTAVMATTRCKKELGLYLCTIYFGEKPAQIEIDSFGAPQSIDLGKESLSFEVAFSNTGEQEAFKTEVSAEIFRRYLVQGNWVEQKVENASKAYQFGGLKHDETRAERIIVPLNENGDFRAVIRASGLEAGFDERAVEFSTTGATGQCYALYCDQPRLIEEKCAARCYCENCLYGSACAEKILQSDNITLGLGPEINLQNAEAETMGSDIVDFALESTHCN